MNENDFFKVCLILPDAFPVPATCGGAIETLVTNLIETNKEDRNILITVCSIYDNKAAHLVKHKKIKNVSFYWTHPQKTSYRIKHFFFRVIRKFMKLKIVSWQAHYGEVAKMICLENFDLLIAEGGDYQAVLDMSKGKYASSKLALHLHHHFIPPQSIADGYGILIGVSDFVTNEYLKKCVIPPKAYVLKNCIDLSKFEREIDDSEKNMLRRNIGIAKNDFIVLYVGRTIEVKGTLELIHATLHIVDASVKLLIVGSPEFATKKMTAYSNKIMGLASTHRDRIKITGYIPNEELYKYYQIADIQCVPSIWEEAAGLVVLEGMASGLPLIITDSGGMVEYVTDKTAVIVRRENLVENLREAIIKLKADERMRTEMSLAAREYIKKYNMEKYYDNFVEIVRDALKEKT